MYLCMTRPVVFCLVLYCIGPVQAFFTDGHELATEMAVRTVKEIMPAFFFEGIETISHCSIDPDVFKLESDFRALVRTEGPDHYFDLEWFDVNELPPTRDDFFWATLGSGHSYRSIGTLPYAITEWTQRLALALAEHRKWPENEAIQAKCCVYAGILSHYTEDACQPLHATIHFDGRVDSDGYSTRTGIHAKMDAILTKLPEESYSLPDTNSLSTTDDILAGVLKTLRESHSFVDRVYELEDKLPEADNPATLTDSDVIALGVTCLDRSVRYTATLYKTAWEKSGDISFPDWHER